MDQFQLRSIVAERREPSGEVRATFEGMGGARPSTTSIQRELRGARTTGTGEATPVAGFVRIWTEAQTTLALHPKSDDFGYERFRDEHFCEEHPARTTGTGEATPVAGFVRIWTETQTTLVLHPKSDDFGYDFGCGRGIQKVPVSKQVTACPV